MDTGGITLVHLPLHWHTPDRGEENLGFNGKDKWVVCGDVEAHHLAHIFPVLVDGSAGLGLSFLRGLQGSFPRCSDSHHSPPARDPESSLFARCVRVLQTNHLWSLHSGLPHLHAGVTRSDKNEETLAVVTLVFFPLFIVTRLINCYLFQTVLIPTPALHHRQALVKSQPALSTLGLQQMYQLFSWILCGFIGHQSIKYTKSAKMQV